VFLSGTAVYCNQVVYALNRTRAANLLPQRRLNGKRFPLALEVDKYYPEVYIENHRPEFGEGRADVALGQGYSSELCLTKSATPYQDAFPQCVQLILVVKRDRPKWSKNFPHFSFLQ